MKRIHSIIGLAALLLSLHLNASELESALRAALQEAPPNQETLLTPGIDLFKPTFELFQHLFGVQRVEVVEQQKHRYTLFGKLTRIDSRSGRNDAIAYRIVREKGAIKEIAWSVNNGEWAPISGPLMEALGNYRDGRPITQDRHNAIEIALEKAMDGTWQRAAQFLIVHIAIRHC